MAAAILRLTTGVVYARSISGTLTFTSSGSVANADGTAALPSYAFASDLDLGLYRLGTNQMAVSGGGAGYWTFDGNTSGGPFFGLQNTAGIAWTSGSISAAYDLSLFRDAANTLAQRNGTNGQTFQLYGTYTNASNYERGGLIADTTNVRLFSFATGTGTNRDIQLLPASGFVEQRNGTSAQAFRIYKTFTDASNYERAIVGWSGSNFVIDTAAAGTGTNRNLQLAAGGSTGFTISPSNISTSAPLLFATDNTYDIGASGATRPRTIYAATEVQSGGKLTIGSASALTWGGSKNWISAPSDGVVAIANSAATGFTRLILGTNDTSGAAIKKNGTGIDFTDGSDTVFTGIRALTVAIPTTGGSISFASPAWIRTAPTISSGFGTSPSVSASNGTAAFTITIGSGGTASTGVITLPTASTGWIVMADDGTTPGVNATKQTGSSTTSATLTNYNTTTGVAAAWTAGDVIRCIAVAY